MCCQHRSHPSCRRPWTCQLAKALKMNHGFSWTSLNFHQTAVGPNLCFQVFTSHHNYKERKWQVLISASWGQQKQALVPFCWNHVVFHNEICFFFYQGEHTPQIHCTHLICCSFFKQPLLKHLRIVKKNICVQGQRKSSGERFWVIIAFQLNL